MRARYLRLSSFVLALLLAGSNLCLSHRAARAQGLDRAGMDTSVDPGDDFFRYANGSWLKAAQIPADRPSYGAFDVIAEKVNQRTAELIKGAAQSANDPEA